MSNKEIIDVKEKIKAVQDTLYVIGGKWKLPIIIAIYHGNVRFNEIKSTIPKITNRVLSKELKHLEENLMINRSVIDDIGVRIEYTITDYCYSITEVLVAMEQWGVQHRQMIINK